MTELRSRYHEFPGYQVALEPHPGLVRVRFAGEVVAESRAALAVRETGHAPVMYFPKADVRFDLLEPTDHTTVCPFKGEASYWTIRVGTAEAENAVWGYEHPFEEVAGLAGHVAFYADRVEWEEEA